MATQPKKKGSDNSTPKFNLSLGLATATLAPPFTFAGVNITYFPLFAEMLKLTKFCDDYLNVAPDFAVFKPAAPMVILSTIHYGQAGVASQSGWTSDNEVMISVPLEWYEPRNGELEYRSTAMFSPYIWVDNVSAQIEGREVFGWPKQQGWQVAEAGSWIASAQDDVNVMKMNAELFAEAYVDQMRGRHPVITVSKAPEPSLFGYPPNPFSSINEIMRVASRQFEIGFAGYEWWMNMLRQTVDGQGLPNLDSAMDAARGMGQDMLSNTVNVKQMRASDEPDMACYQAITNATMETNKINGMGLLGELSLLRGDLSGGYQIEIHDYETLPVVDSLGLHAESVGSDGVQVLKPIMPFWMNADMIYKKGENVAWRAKSNGPSLWQNDTRIEVPDKKDPLKTLPLYSRAGSQSYQVSQGPFSIDRASVRVLPLLANPQKLCDLITRQKGMKKWQAFFGQVPQDIARIEPWGNYVYLLATSLQEHSMTQDVGRWEELEIEFAVPLKMYRTDPETHEEFVSYGWVSPFMYSNSEIGATTARELNGWRMLESRILRPESSWVDNVHSPAGGTPLLQLRMNIAKAIGTGTSWNTVIDIIDGFQMEDFDDPRQKHQMTEWGQAVKKSLTGMSRVSHASRPLSGDWQPTPEFAEYMERADAIKHRRQPMNQMSFKQFRDAAVPMNACYQALVNTPICFESVEIQPSNRAIHANIYRYPTQPIVEMLGLQVKSTHTTRQGTYDVVPALSPFSLILSGTSDLGVDLCWRAGNRSWETDEPKLEELFSARRRETETTAQFEPQMMVNALLAEEGQYPYGVRVNTVGPVANDIFPKDERVGPHTNFWAPADFANTDEQTAPGDDEVPDDTAS